MTDRDNGRGPKKLFPGEEAYGWALSGHYEYAFQLGFKLMTALGLKPFDRVFEIHSNDLTRDPNVSRRGHAYRESLREIARRLRDEGEEVQMILGFSHRALMGTSVKFFGCSAVEINEEILDVRRRERINWGLAQTISANKTDKQRERDMGPVYALFYDPADFIARFGQRLQMQEVVV